MFCQEGGWVQRSNERMQVTKNKSGPFTIKIFLLFPQVLMWHTCHLLYDKEADSGF